MLIELKVKTELSFIMHFFRSLEGFKQISNIILGKQRTAQDSHDFHDGAVDLQVMFDNANETICDDGNVYLNTDCILGFSPKGLDPEMLFNPLEKQLNLPPVFIKERNILGIKIEIISVIGESPLEFWRVENNATDRRWIIRPISLASKTDCLVTEDIVFSFLEIKSAFNLIGGMELFPCNKERPQTIDFIETGKVKVSSIKHIARIMLVCKPIHRIDIMYLSVGDSVEHGYLRDDVNLSVDSYTRLGRPKLRPSENGEAKINRCGVNRIEPPMQFKLSGKTFRLSNCHHVKRKLFKDSIVSDGVRLRKDLPVDITFSKAEKKRFSSMGNCYICKFPEASAAEQLSEHQNQQVAPMGKKPSSCAVVVLDHQTLEIPLRKEIGNLRKNIGTIMHTCSIFDLGAKVRISKVRQGFQTLCNCA